LSQREIARLVEASRRWVRDVLAFRRRDGVHDAWKRIDGPLPTLRQPPSIDPVEVARLAAKAQGQRQRSKQSAPLPESPREAVEVVVDPLSEIAVAWARERRHAGDDACGQ
jgi:hypothetical protein